MAVQLPANNDAAIEIRPAVITRVSTKTNWTDADWIVQPYLYCDNIIKQAPPSKSQANLVLKIGNILRADRIPFMEDFKNNVEGFSKRINIANKFVRIEEGTDNENMASVFYGYIPSDVLNPDDGQIFTVYGLSHLMDRDQISNGHASQGGAEIALGYLPAFNRRSEKGQTVLGNRTTAMLANCHLFSSDGAIWSNSDIITYLLEKHNPTGIAFRFDGDKAILGLTFGVYDLAGMTLFQALNVLIDRRRGVGWDIKVGVGALVNAVTIQVYSMLSSEIKVGAIVLPAAKVVSTPDFTGNKDFNCEIQKDYARSYKKVTVKGGYLVSCFSVGGVLGNLEEAWTAAEESAYADGAKNAAGYAGSNKRRMEKSRRFEDRR